MWDSLGQVVVGLGLFVYGMSLVGTSLKLLASRRMRAFLGKWTNNRPVAVLSGFLSGAITQSTNNATLLICNLVTTRLLDLRGAMMIVAASNVGTVLIVFLVTINIKLAVMYLLGVATLLYGMKRGWRENPVLSVTLGAGILLFGFSILAAGTRPLVRVPEISSLLTSLQGTHYFILIPIVMGIVFRILTQSTGTVTVLAISLQQAGLLTLEQAMALVFAAPLGSAITMAAILTKARGPARQLMVFQMMFECTGSLALGAMLAVELGTGIPLIRQLTGMLADDPARRLAIGLLVMRLVPFTLSFPLNGLLARFLARRFPPSPDDNFARPLYLSDSATGEPETAMDLLEKEQVRLLSHLPDLVESVRLEPEAPRLFPVDLLHRGLADLGREIDGFTGELFNGGLDHLSSERLIKLQSRQHLIARLEEAVYHYVKEADGARQAAGSADLGASITESLHAVLMVALDAAQNRTAADLDQVQTMTADKGKLMEVIRKPYLASNSPLSQEEKMAVLRTTDLYQRAIWLIHEWSKTR